MSLLARTMTIEHDLFGALVEPPVIPGLASCDDVLSPAQETELIARIDASDLAPFRFQGWLGKRLTRSFGWTYDFDNGSFEQGEPMPDWLLPVRDLAANATGLNPAALVQALVIRYDPGAGIGWHKDRPVFEHVVGLSLGNAAEMRFRRRLPKGFDRHTALLKPRSLYRLSGEVRDAWEHSIVPMEIPRWSITFRSLRNRSADRSSKNRDPAD